MRKAPQALVRNNWQPFYLTSVYPSSAEPDVTQSLSISDIISSFNPSSTSSSSNSNNHNDVNYVCLINYMVDPDWLFTACPLLQSVPVLLLHGHRGMEIGPRSNVISSIVDMGEERYGTHHSKMMIVFYNSGVRIAIGTANLIEVDWTIKTQGFYVQDFPLKNTTQTASSSSSSSSQINSAPASIPNTLKAESENDFSFEKDLIGYLRCVRLLSPIAQRMLAERVIARLSLYDYHTAEVVLIPSVPGRHAVSRPLEGINRWGHMKLRDSLLHHKFFVGSQGRQNKITQSTNPNPNPSSLSSINRVSTGTKNSCGEESRNDESVLVMQASSISTMGKNDGFASELAASMDSTGPNTKIRLLWPTVKTVRQSLGGYQSGTSLPCSSKHLYEDAPQCTRLRPFFSGSLHLWDSAISGRSRATPHIKSYCTFRLRPQPPKLTSASAVEDVDATGTSKRKREDVVDLCSSSDEDSVVLVKTTSKNIEVPTDYHKPSHAEIIDTEIELDWFLLTSANLSQAAWGVLQRNNQSLYIKSYEMGVLYLPHRVTTNRRMFSCTPQHPVLGYNPSEIDKSKVKPTSKNPTFKRFVPMYEGLLGRNSMSVSMDEIENMIRFPIPYTLLSPMRYRVGVDVPWVWDRPYMKPDVLGRIFPGISN